MRTRGVAVLLAAAACAVTACERTRSGPQSSTGAAGGRSASAPATNGRAAVRWNDTIAGRSLFVAGANPTEAIDIMPRFTDSTVAEAPAADTLLGGHPQVDLFARKGLVGTAKLSAQADGNFSAS